MAETRLNHRGHGIVISGTKDSPKVLVDGGEIDVSSIAQGLYATGGLPHTNFTSLEALAKAVIDHSTAFYGRRDV